MRRLAFIVLALAVISGCTSQTPQAPEKPQPADALTGRAAFQKLYISARGWAADAKPYQLQSSAVGDYQGAEGKAVVWRASFASELQHGSRPYGWSGIDSPDAPSRGVSPGAQDNYTPGNTFDMNFLKVDSDKAYEIAEKHGGDKITGIPIVYWLDWAPGENKLVWHVIYGNNRDNAKLVVDIDASTGEFIRKEK
jgi:hypothetical protein